MKLTEYFISTDTTAADLARKCEVSPSTITRAAKGEITPLLPLMRKIAQHTDGKVTPNDWLES